MLPRNKVAVFPWWMGGTIAWWTGRSFCRLKSYDHSLHAEGSRNKSKIRIDPFCQFTSRSIFSSVRVQR
jgi:hypothetical protein